MLDVFVRDYRKPFGQSSSQHSAITSHIVEIAQEVLETTPIQSLKVFNMGGAQHDQAPGRKDTRLIALVNACQNGMETPTPVNTVLDNHVPTINLLPPHEDGGTMSDYLPIFYEGVQVAEYIHDFAYINILYDMFTTTDEDILNMDKTIFRHILQTIYNEKYKNYAHRDSLFFSEERHRIVDSVKKYAAARAGTNINELKRSLERYENDVRSYTQSITTILRNITRNKEQIEAASASSDKVFDNIMKDIELLQKHPLIEDVQFKEDLFIVKTDHIDFSDGRGNNFRGGKYTMKINMFNSSIMFDSTIKRRSYFDMFCPHPHISSSGSPCLGSLSTSVSELCASWELYALVMTLIGYLEAANVDDVAGKGALNWDRINEDGTLSMPNKQRDYEECGMVYYHMDKVDWKNAVYAETPTVILRNEYRDENNESECSECGSWVDDEDGSCETIMEDGTAECFICDSCLEHYYYYDHDADTYYHNEYEQ